MYTICSYVFVCVYVLQLSEALSVKKNCKGFVVGAKYVYSTSI